MKKRKPEIVVISDVHLGTFGCHARELLEYLNAIKPKKLILNGDIIDIWNFRKSYFPKSHLEVIKRILDLNAGGTEVIYITGNHDELFRKFSNTNVGTIRVVDKLVLDLDGKKAWFFHGDIFDASITNARWIAKLGSQGYDLLILINRLINYILVHTGRKKFSLSKKIKDTVKGTVKYITDFEKTTVKLAIEQGYKYVVCGHIHRPRMVRKVWKNDTCLYLNSGDWVENLSALEYDNKKWHLIYHKDLDFKSKKSPVIAATTIVA